MNQRRKFKLLKDVPFLPKGTEYIMYDSTGFVHWITGDGKESEYPLRAGLAGYLWLLCTDKKYMELIESDYE